MTCSSEKIMAPTLVLLMRHGEKPSDEKDPNLSADGLSRAHKLATYIPATFCKPDALFASAISKHSARPYQTLEPLSKKTGIPIDAAYADQNYAGLAKELLSDAKFAGKRIVIAWHHERIPALAQALGASAGSFPDPWDPAVFNLILHVAWQGNSGPTVIKVSEPF
jgi:broad specificity phosphatase PhoE